MRRTLGLRGSGIVESIAFFMPKKSILPFIVLAGGFAWYGVFAWLRGRKGLDLKTADPLLLWGVLGLLGFMIAAGVFAVIQWG